VIICRLLKDDDDLRNGRSETRNQPYDASPPASATYPYAELLAESRRRSRSDPEFELIDTGVVEGNRFFDVPIEYAKAATRRGPARLAGSFQSCL
jgi:hypothetical protein